MDQILRETYNISARLFGRKWILQANEIFFRKEKIYAFITKKLTVLLKLDQCMFQDQNNVNF